MSISDRRTASRPVSDEQVSPGPPSTSSIFVRMFGYRAPSTGNLSQFRHWIGPACIFIGLVCAIIIFAFLPAGWFLVTATILPVIVLCVIIACLWYGWLSAKTDLSLLRTIQRVTYFLSYPLALYVGVVAAWLLNHYTDEYLAHLLVWQLCCGFAIAALTGSNALQYGVRISFATVPTVFMLIETSDPKYTSLAVLSYLAVCLATLIKLDLSETLKASARASQYLTRQRDSTAQRLSIYLDSVEDFLWETNRDGQITYLSENFYRLTGCTISDTDQADIISLDIVKSYIPDETVQQLQHAIAGRQVFSSLQVPVTRLDQTVSWYSCTGHPVFLKDGAFAGYKGIAMDISPSIQAREKIKSYTDRLESRVETRTQDLLGRLQEAEQHAASAQKKLDERNTFFSAMLTHLQNPEANAPKAVKPSSPEGPSQAAREQHRLIHIVSNAMQVADDYRNNKDRVFAIDDLLHDVVADPSLGHSAKGCTVAVSSLCGEQIFADPGALRIALIELFSHAARRSLVTPVGTKKTAKTKPALTTIDLRATIDDKGLSIVIADFGAPFTDDAIHVANAEAASLFQPSDFNRDVISTMGVRLAAAMVHSQGGNLYLHPAPEKRIGASKKQNAPQVANEAIIHLPRVRLFNRKIA